MCMCVGRGVRSVYVCWEGGEECVCGGGECVCRPYVHVGAYGVCVRHKCGSTYICVMCMIKLVRM